MIEETLKKAEKLSGSEEFEEALVLLDKLDTEGEQGDRICFVRGNVYARKGQLESAHNWYGESLKKGFVDTKLFFNFGLLKEQMGKPGEAIEMYGQAFELDPTNVAPLDKIVAINLQMGDLAEAIRIMNKIMHSFPELFDGFHAYADLLLTLRKSGEALELLQKHEERFSGNPLYVYDKTRALKGEGQLQEALEYLESHREKFEAVTLQYSYLKLNSELLYQLEQYEKSVPSLIELFDRYRDRDAALKLIVISFEKKEFELAYEIAQRLMEMSREGISHYVAGYFSAVALEALEKKDEAREAYRNFLAEVYQMKECPWELLNFRLQAEYALGREKELQITLELLEQYLVKVAGEDAEQLEAGRKQIQELKEVLKQRANSFC